MIRYYRVRDHVNKSELIGRIQRGAIAKSGRDKSVGYGFEDILAVWRQKMCNLSDTTTRVRRV